MSGTVVSFLEVHAPLHHGVKKVVVRHDWWLGHHHSLVDDHSYTVGSDRRDVSDQFHALLLTIWRGTRRPIASINMRAEAGNGTAGGGAG